MATKKKADGVEETNRRLARIEDSLTTASKVFNRMYERLEHLDEGQHALVEGQQRVIDRLDRLVEASTRDRTGWVDRFGRMEQRLERLEAEVFVGDTPR